MTLFDRLQALAKEKNTNFKQIEMAAGIGNGTIRRWEAQSPQLNKIQAVAEYLQVSIDYLLYGNSKSATSDNDTSLACDGKSLSQTEMDLVAMYRMIPDEDKKGVFDYLHFRYEQASGQKGSIYSTYTDEEKGVKKELLSTQELA